MRLVVGPRRFMMHAGDRAPLQPGREVILDDVCSKNQDEPSRSCMRCDEVAMEGGPAQWLVA